MFTQVLPSSLLHLHMCAVNSKHGPKVVTADTADTTDMNLTTQFSDYTLVCLKIKNQHSAIWLEMLSNVLFCSIVLSCTNLCSTVENLCKYSNDIHFLTKSCHVLHVLHTSTSASQVFGILGTKMWEIPLSNTRFICTHCTTDDAWITPHKKSNFICVENCCVSR